MSDFRGSLSQTLTGSLESVDERERPVDLVHAFAKADRLGTMLWRLKFDHDASVLSEAITELSQVAKARRELCDLAISEWLEPGCRSCSGAKELIINEKRVTCPTCNGSGLHRYSDTWRAGRLQCSFAQARSYNKTITRIHGIIGKFDRHVSGIMHYELER